jgi:hypothetical protein
VSTVGTSRLKQDSTHSIFRMITGVLFGMLVLLAWVGLPFDLPFVGFGLASAFIFQVIVRPRWLQLASVMLVACALVLVDSFLLRKGHVHNLLSISLGMLGLVSFALLGFQTIWAEGEEKQQLKMVLIPAAALTFFTLASQRLLNLGAILSPNTLDLYTYVFDGSLGFQPSFLVGTLFQRVQIVREIGNFTYFALPLGIALVYGGHLKRNRSSPWFVLELFMSAGLLGYFLYLLFPATGPIYVASHSFPNSPVPFSQISLRAIPVNLQIVRNAMPSLHMAWALLIWYNSKPFSRFVRALAFSYVLITILDTLGTGEHYLIDLVVAVPFSVALQALCTRSIPMRSNARLVPLFGGTVLTIMWLIMLRYCIAVFVIHPFVPWVCIVGSVTLPGWWLARLLAASREVSQHSSLERGSPTDLSENCQSASTQ